MPAIAYGQHPDVLCYHIISPGVSPSPPLTLVLFWILISAHSADKMISSFLPTKENRAKVRYNSFYLSLQMSLDV